MSKTVTIRLDDRVYDRFRRLAESDNRPLSNFIQTAALRYVDSEQFVDEFEMAEIEANTELKERIESGRRDARARRGRFV